MERIFGKKVPLEQRVRDWRSNLRAEDRQLQKQLRDIEVEEKKLMKTIKTEAKNPAARQACKSLAKELVRSRKAKDRIIGTKAQLNSVSLQLQQQMAQIKVSGCLNKSADVMRAMNQSMRLPVMSAQMQAMSREMMKAGIMEEMMEDVFESLDEEDEEEVEEEVNKVLESITHEAFGSVNVPTKNVKQREDAVAEDEEMKSRLEALKE